jgi:hypothetical protein
MKGLNALSRSSCSQLSQTAETDQIAVTLLFTEYDHDPHHFLLEMIVSSAVSQF